MGWIEQSKAEEEAFFKQNQCDWKGHRIWWRRIEDSPAWIYKKFEIDIPEKELKYRDLYITITVECGNCGMDVVIDHNQTGTETTTLIAQTSCEFPDGVPCKFTLDVPSGFMVVENDMRQLLDPPMPPNTVEGDTPSWRRYYVNTHFGTAMTTLWYAERKMAHGFVGNSCPGILELSPDHYQIGSWLGYDIETSEDIDFTPKGAKKVASVCTDLWWYSIMDQEEYDRLGGQPDQWTDVIECKPGRWEFEHHTTMNYFNRDDYQNATVYTDIRYLGGIDGR